MADTRLLEALAVTAELTGTELTEVAARVMVSDLSCYPLDLVLQALTRCRRELRGRFALSDIITRIDDGRPGPNEAWSMIPQSEDSSVVWTTEMAEAFGVCAPLLREGQVIAARSAFIESYTTLIGSARARLEFPTWLPSLGHDANQRQSVLEDAVRKGRLTAKHAQALLPHSQQSGVFLEQEGAVLKALVNKVTANA